MRRLLLLPLLPLLPLIACVSSTAAIRETPAAQASGLAFIHDDYPRALAEARERGRPLFIDFWAPWCHTCRSMNANVFPDARLAPLGDRFVFLSIDTEKPENAAVVERFPLSAWPTLLVVEPNEERAVLRWLGSATVEQLDALLEDGARAVKGGAEGADALLARADRLYAEGDAAGAATLLAQVLAEAPADWARRSRAVESSLMALALGKSADPQACARLAASELKRLPRSASWANVAAWGLGCALEVPDSAEWQAHVVAPLEARVQEALGAPRIDMAGDDRSGLYAVWLDARKAAKDAEGAHRVATEWLTFLERARAEAPSADARAVYDGHLMGAAMALGELERARQALVQSEAALPGDYNPPSRLAVVLLAMGRLDEALAASDRALPKSYGPRKVKVLNDRADILEAQGKLEQARATWSEALALAASLPEGQRPRSQVKRAERKLDPSKVQAGGGTQR